MSKNLTMKDILDGIIQEEAQLKLAAVQRYYGDDEDAFGMLNDALTLIKEAQDAGQIPPLDPSQAISVAVDVVETEREAALWKEAGEAVAYLLNEIGIGPETIENIKTAEDADALGRIAARALATAQTGQDFLGLSEEE